jgi:hypothetical protein
VVDDPAVAQEDDAVGPGSQLGVMGHHDPSHSPPAGVPQQTHHRFTIDGIQRTRRFIGQQEATISHHCAGYRHPLPLTAREIIRKVG